MNKVTLNLILFLIIQYTAVSAQENLYAIQDNRIMPNFNHIDSIQKNNFETGSYVGVQHIQVHGVTYTFKFMSQKYNTGDYNIIEVYKDNEMIFACGDADGMVTYDKRPYLEKYASSKYLIEVPLPDNSKALLITGQHFGSQIERLFIFIATQSDVKLVYNKEMIVSKINTVPQFELIGISNMPTYEDIPDIKHRFWYEGGSIRIKNL